MATAKQQRGRRFQVEAKVERRIAPCFIFTPHLQAPRPSVHSPSERPSGTDAMSLYGGIKFAKFEGVQESPEPTPKPQAVPEKEPAESSAKSVEGKCCGST